MPAYFTRGSGHNELAQYSERAEDYSKNLDRLARKFETARTLVPKPDVELQAKGKIGIIGYGTTHWAIVESRDQLSNEAQLTTSYLRLRAYPFTPEVFEFIDKCDRVYVVEQNRDSQMLSLLRMECNPAQIGKLRSIPHYAGLPIDGRSVTTGARVGHVLSDVPDQAGPKGPALRRETRNGHTDTASPREEAQSHRPRANRLSRQQDDPVRRMRAQRDHRAHHRRLL
jgi:2-oxoglutarate ferredoxin oxidoreductase subunit alpha